MKSADLAVLRDRLSSALPRFSYELGELEHEDSGVCHAALVMEMPERVKDSVWRVTIAVIDDEVNFFVHVHGESQDLTTHGAHRFSKACADVDEVFALVHGCWTGSVPS